MHTQLEWLASRSILALLTYIAIAILHNVMIVSTAVKVRLLDAW